MSKNNTTAKLDDKACVLAALDVMHFEVGITVTLEVMQKAIDAYLSAAERRGS